ncbi:24-dehydrocholesterol reductase [Achlya hypogyna]|uniref:Delta(24)-sterol reductase n=1 Tax=Achlya hypogyna TaxID=1202772 RepID=A0A1V9YJ41_ACHHY|nr:24-dehydrocholesterol reductase [Achlya hypogyna]
MKRRAAREEPRAAPAASPETPLPDATSWTAYVLIHYRWVFVCFFLLPLSFVYDILYYVRSRIIFYFNSAPLQHKKRVAEVQRQVHQWNAEGRTVPMCTARPGWQNISYRRGKYKKTLFNVKVDMMDILNVDTAAKTVRVEPLVTMGQLSATLNPMGWTLPIVPELDDLTVGGLVMGTGIETSSHQHGLFQHICKSFELVLADGSVVTCSKESNADLFYAVPWSYGTLGFLTAVEIDIVPCLPYVKLEYTPVTTLDEACAVFRAKSESPDHQFVETLMYSLDAGVVMTGTMVATFEADKLNAIGKWHKPWFFKHVEGFLAAKKCSVEYIPLRDYYHRHSRSIFWELQDIIPFGNHALFRYLLGWLVPPKVSLLKLTQSNAIKELYDNHHLIQDMLVPISTLKESLECFQDNVAIYPLWLCPFKLPRAPGMLQTKASDELFVDIGAYGVPQVLDFHPIETTRRIEAFVRSVGGFQMLYADSYMTETEFESMFDHKLYHQMRSKYNSADAFPSVYGKVSRAARD